MPETKAHFIDTNIWLYSLLDTGEAEKTEAAQALIKSSEAIVSPQIISEVCANLVKKAKMPEEEIRKFIEGIYAKHRVTEYDMRVFLAASELREEYSLFLGQSDCFRRVSLRCRGHLFRRHAGRFTCSRNGANHQPLEMKHG